MGHCDRLAWRNELAITRAVRHHRVGHCDRLACRNELAITHAVPVPGTSPFAHYTFPPRPFSLPREFCRGYATSVVLCFILICVIITLIIINNIIASNMNIITITITIIITTIIISII